jgi:hypothetical protein
LIRNIKFLEKIIKFSHHFPEDYLGKIGAGKDVLWGNLPGLNGFCPLLPWPWPPILCYHQAPLGTIFSEEAAWNL